MTTTEDIDMISIPATFAVRFSNGGFRLYGVLAGILRHRDDPTSQELAELLDCSIGSVKGYLRELVEHGVIVRQQVRGRRIMALACAGAKELKPQGGQPAHIRSHHRDAKA